MTDEPREVAERRLVRPPGCDRQDAVRNARAFMRDVRDPGSQPVGDVRLRCSGLVRVAVPVRPLGSGLGSLPTRGLRVGALRGGRVASSRSSRGSGRSSMTVSEARDTLRVLATTPFKSQRVARVSTSPSSRPGLGQGPRKPSCTTVSSPGNPSTSATLV